MAPRSGLAAVPGSACWPSPGPAARWLLQRGEKSLTRRFKPISRQASGEPRKLPTIRSVVNKYDKIANYRREASMSGQRGWLWPCTREAAQWMEEGELGRSQ